MDVLEDLHAVLRVVLDYIGLDIDEVGEYLAHLNRRQRLAIQDFGHFVAEGWNRNITQPRVHIANQWHHWRSDIRHKSLIRIIGTRLPLKPPKRLKISSHMLRQRRRHNSCDSDYSLNSIASTCPSTDEDMVWVEEDLGDNCIRVRAQKREDLSDCEDDIPDDLSDDMFINRNNIARSPLNSTMISSVSMVSSCDPEALSKISALEDELTALRKQIAMLVMTQEQINRSQAIPNMTNNSTFTKVEDVTSTMDEPVVCPAPIPPPPPPPPPPATPKTVENRIMVSSTNTATSEESIVEQVEDIKPATEALAKPPTLTDVLKGLHSVKLRSVQRSPGGTPMKVKCPKLTNHCDPASLIAQALKKKFANHHVYSPEVDKENENQEFSSPECSPHVMRKKVKRRSILFEDRRKSSGPLREVNA